MKLASAALADLVEDGAANTVLRRKRRSVDLQFGNGLKHRGIGILAMRKRGRRSIRQNVAVRQVAVDRDYLAWIRCALG